MSLISRIAKKLRRRKRDKGIAKRQVSPTMTEAERLIMANWGLSFKNPEPERAGTLRRMKREKAKFDANKKIPSGDKMTRQRMRAMARLHEKRIRQQTTMKQTVMA
jgi:hypothetical protein